MAQETWGMTWSSGPTLSFPLLGFYVCDRLVQASDAVAFQQPRPNIGSRRTYGQQKRPGHSLHSLLLRPVATTSSSRPGVFQDLVRLVSFSFVSFALGSWPLETILNHESLIHLWAGLPSFVFSIYLFGFLSVCPSKFFILKEPCCMSLQTSFLGCYWPIDHCSLGILINLHDPSPITTCKGYLSVSIFGDILSNISILKDSYPPSRK